MDIEEGEPPARHADLTSERRPSAVSDAAPDKPELRAGRIAENVTDLVDRHSAGETGSEIPPKGPGVATPNTYSLRDLLRADFWRRVEVFDQNMSKLDRPKKPLTWLRAIRIVFQRTALAVTFYRFSHAAHVHRIPFLPRFFSDLNMMLHGLEIDPGAIIGPGFYVGHPVGNVIGLVRMGRNVSVMGGVGIGLRGGLDYSLEGFPSVGDEVLFMPGSSAWGPIEIGSRSTIGARATVTQSIPPGSVVVAPKSQVIVNPPPGWPL